MPKIDLNIIKQFKNAFKFEKEADKNSLKLYLNEETKKECKGITWLYECGEQSAAFIGIKNDQVYAIDSDGFLLPLCEGLENIPYELIRIDSEYSENQLAKNVFYYDEKFESDILKYEDWCKENGVKLDIQKVYHDENGNLFEKYFEVPFI